jgi:formylglycine-generating enzyme
MAAAGGKNQRYAWGQTGLVCRRAVYGLRRGPCAEGGTGPEQAGSRPSGRTTTGLYDMVGNVAEWALEGDQAVAMGGSYLNELASDLKVWSTAAPQAPSDTVGFRCVYAL